MYAQAIWFDGPRSAELIAASDRAGLERIEPTIRQHPDLVDDLVAMIVMRRPDGGELVVTITETDETIDRATEIIMSTPLLPGEDPALLPGPDHVERYEVVHTLLGKATLR
jgi:hypothetical protein